MNAKQNIPVVFAILALCLLILFILFSDKGFFDLRSLQSERNGWIKKNMRVTDKNILLYNEINRLEHDLKFVENLARQEHGMIEKNELIIKFNNSKESKSD